MDAYLEYWAPSGRELRLLSESPFTIGRHASNNLVLLGDEEVSRLHAALEQVGPAWVLRDLSSRNGTRVNGELIGADRPLVSGDELRAGTARLTFHDPDTQQLLDATRGAEPPPILTPRERDVLMQLFRPAAHPGPFNEPGSIREIAAALVVSDAAIKQHLANLYDKFGIAAGPERRRVALANEALRRGAISLADVRAHFG